MIDVVVDRVDAVLEAAAGVAAVLRAEGRGASAAIQSDLGRDLDGFRVLLDHDDGAAVNARRFSSDRRRTLAGRLVLRSLLLDRLDRSWRDLPDLLISRNCDSCGSAHGMPRYPAVSLSSATSGGWVAAAVAAQSTSVGIDIETVRESTWSGFDSVALHPGERDYFRGRGIGSHGRLQRWADKEATLKAAGVGLLADPSALRIAESGRTRTLVRQGSASGMRVPCLEWRVVLETSAEAAEGLHVAALSEAAGLRDAVASVSATAPETVRLRAFADLHL